MERVFHIRQPQRHLGASELFGRETGNGAWQNDVNPCEALTRTKVNSRGLCETAIRTSCVYYQTAFAFSCILYKKHAYMLLG
eukprot:7086349-Pyramimonas_sp.AAC.1